MSVEPAIGPDVFALRSHLVDAHGFDFEDVEHESTSTLTGVHDTEHSRVQHSLDHEHDETVDLVPSPDAHPYWCKCQRVCGGDQ